MKMLAATQLLMPFAGVPCLIFDLVLPAAEQDVLSACHLRSGRTTAQEKLRFHMASF
jgi:hypothetical protein